VYAKDIIALLADRHHHDLFVPECKVNSTWGAKTTYRLDAWAMRRSWSPWTTIGYEIKVSRSDFVHDDKWPNYLPLCHQFSFVCPRGLIDPKEVGEGIGLMWVTKNGKRLITKVKAPRREIEPPIELLIYVLMSRAQIVNSTYRAHDKMSRQEEIAYWRHWLAQKAESRSLGHLVSEAVASRVRQAEDKLHRAQMLLERVKEADALLQKHLGLGLPDLSSWRMEEQVLNAISLLPKQLVDKARAEARELTRFADAAEEQREKLVAKKEVQVDSCLLDLDGIHHARGLSGSRGA